MMRIFVDTSAFYALLDWDDRNHQKAKKKWVEILEATPASVTTNYVLLEMLALSAEPPWSGGGQGVSRRCVSYSKGGICHSGGTSSRHGGIAFDLEKET